MKSDVVRSTRDKILDIGADLIHQKGFNHTGIQEILNLAGVPKGSFYNYFKSKEDFGLEVIGRFVFFFKDFSGRVLENPSLGPVERMLSLLDLFIDYFRSRGYTRGCPVGNLAQEMGDLSPAIREKLRLAVREMVQVYSRLLAEGQAAGEVSENLDVKETAAFLVSSWHGALMHMKIEKSEKPLVNHRTFVLNLLQSPQSR